MRPLSLAALCPLYLDLALAYAFLGEYFLASKVFKEAVDSDATSAVGWFGFGLAQAELCNWRNSRRSWKECLRCFESVNGQQEGIRYALFRTQDEAAHTPEVGLDSGEWTLERTRVEFNFRVALLEKGSKNLGVAPRAAGQKRPGLNGLPAALRFGPGWDASLQSLDSPLLPHELQWECGAASSSRFQPTVQTPLFSSSSYPGASLPPRISSRKPLPALPQTTSIPIPSLTNTRRFNRHSPWLDKDPFTSSPEKYTLDPFADSPQKLMTTRPRNQYHDRLSRQSTLFNFYESSDSDDDESRDTFSDIDDTIASWSGLGQTQGEEADEDQTLVVEEGEEEGTLADGSYEEGQEEEENLANETYVSTSQNPSDLDGEILQPRVFEGFGPSSQER